MSNAAITTIINDLGVVITSNTPTNNFQDDVIFEMARGAFGEVMPQVDASFIAVTAGTATYTLPTSSSARTPLLIFYDDFQLSRVTKDEAWSYRSDWRRTTSDKPVGYVLDPEDRTQFSLIPVPRRDGQSIGVTTPYNGFAAENVLVIYTVSDVAFAGTTYDDLKLPIALEVLSRELGRDSDHKDELASQIARSLAQFFFEMFTPFGVQT
jgi:hypothetical protein